MFHLSLFTLFLVRFGLLSGHLLGKKELLTRLSIIFCHFVIFVISRFGFEGRIWVLIAPVPGHYLLVTFRKILDNQSYLDFPGHFQIESNGL